MGGRYTDLRPDELGQRADELRGRVARGALALGVDELADGVPEGGFEALAKG